mgnify:CR=1 FL=1
MIKIQLVSVIMVLSLAGCGGDDKGSASDTAESAVESAQHQALKATLSH